MHFYGSDFPDRFFISDSTRSQHQIHYDLVRHPHHGIIAQVRLAKFKDGAFRQRLQSGADPALVFGRTVQKDINVLGRSQIPVVNDGHAANHEMLSASDVQFPAERDQIVLDRWTRQTFR